jgi:hypothetical protein
MMAQSGGSIEGDVLRLELRPGDLIVLKCHQPLTNEIARDWVARISELLPDDVKVITLNPGQDLTVLSDDDLKRLGLRRTT